MSHDEPSTRLTSTVPAARAGTTDRRGLSPGMVVGRIRILKKIGKGGMGEVWLGRDELLGRDVAVKVLAGVAGVGNDAACAAFLQGARAAASLAHPGLNTVYDAGVIEGVPYLVLELLDGLDLAEVVGRVGRLDLPAARAVICAVAAAVAELHHRDLVHRDVKPSNVVLTAGGGVVLTDFGLACAQPAVAIRAGGPGVAGTPQYMAVEMFDGVVSARTDVCAIALTAYHLLCGREPFEGMTVEVRRRENQALDTVPLREAGVPDAVVDVIVRASTADVLFRPKSARHLLELFEKAFDSAGIACAGGIELARLVGACAARPEARGTPAGTVRPVGLREVVTEFAAQRRGRKSGRPQVGALPAGAERQIDSAQVRQRLRERRRVRVATAVASVCGAAVGMAIFAGLSSGGPRWSGWLVARVGQTPAGVIEAAAGFLAVAVGCVGVAVLLYRLVRGAPLPELQEHARCGWCRQELAGISRPICPECGHAIGDRGPDVHGDVPPGRRARLMMPVLVLAFFPAAFALIAFVTGIVLSVLTAPSHGPLHGTIATFAVLMMSLAVTLTFYEGFLQFILAHTGRCWCAGCGHELRDLREPVCPACGQRI